MVMNVFVFVCQWPLFPSTLQEQFSLNILIETIESVMRWGSSIDIGTPCFTRKPIFLCHTHVFLLVASRDMSCSLRFSQ